MKYIILLGDGMADYPIKELGGKTPLQAACKPSMDALASRGEMGLVKTVPDSMKPGSDICNMSVLGYDPLRYYTGRSPLEAYNMGIYLKDDEIAVRCNLVHLSGEENYAEKSMLDYSAGEITTDEAREIIDTLDKHLSNDVFRFYAGISYRHCLLVKGKIGSDLTPPHDITGKKISSYLPKGLFGKEFLELQEKSALLLKNHPVNRERAAKGLATADSIWLWGEGTRPALPLFKDRTGLDGAMISAVDLLRGIARVSGMQVINVDGATGNIDTAYEAKAAAAIQALEDNDFVYIHVEAPDECGHQGNLREKIKAIENIDHRLLSPLLEGLQAKKWEYSIMILPDHPTPVSTKTHARDPVPFLIYRKGEEKKGFELYSEENAKKSGLIIEKGDTLIDRFINR